MAKRPDTVIETVRGPVRVAKDRYMGGWRLWIGDYMRFSDERFMTKKDAIAFLEPYLPE